MKQKIMNYEEPMIEIIAAEVEKGFAASGLESEQLPDLEDGGILSF